MTRLFNGTEPEMNLHSSFAENKIRNTLSNLSPFGSFSRTAILNENEVKGRTLHANMRRDPVKERIALAKKHGMLMVSRAFKSEKELDGTIRGIHKDIARLEKDIAAREDEEVKNKAKLKALREEYGVEENSEEDLALKRLAASVNRGMDIKGDDLDRLTPYQQKALFYMSSSQKNDIAVPLEKERVKANLQGIKDIELERLKTDPVGDAIKQADELESAAYKDAFGMLIGEGIRHIEEEQEKAAEEAEAKKEEEKSEKKEEAKRLAKEARREQMLENLRDNDSFEITSSEKKYARATRLWSEADAPDEISEATVTALTPTQVAASKTDVNSEVTNLLNKLALTTEDIKGAAIDSII